MVNDYISLNLDPGEGVHRKSFWRVSIKNDFCNVHHIVHHCAIIMAMVICYTPFFPFYLANNQIGQNSFNLSRIAREIKMIYLKLVE